MVCVCIKKKEKAQRQKNERERERERERTERKKEKEVKTEINPDIDARPSAKSFNTKKIIVADGDMKRTTETKQRTVGKPVCAVQIAHTHHPSCVFCFHRQHWSVGKVGTA